MTKITRKAPASGPGGATAGSLEGDLTDPQLRLVGLVVLEWNEIEFLIQGLVYSVLRLPAEHWIQLTLAVPHGASIGLLQSGFKSLQLPKPMVEAISASLHAATAVKQSRDGVAHARVINGQLAIGGNMKRGGDSLHLQETNLSVEALLRLHDHMKMIRGELRWAINLIDMWKSMAAQLHPRTGRQPFPEELYDDSSELQIVTGRILESQKRREKAGPTLTFPY